MANSGDIRGKSSRYGVFGDTWQLGKNPGGEVFRSALGTRGGFRGRFEEGFRRNSRQGFGDISRFRKSLWAQPSGHVARSEGGTEGLVRRRAEKGFRGMASGTSGALRRAVRQGLRRN